MSIFFRRFILSRPSFFGNLLPTLKLKKKCWITHIITSQMNKSSRLKTKYCRFYKILYFSGALFYRGHPGAICGNRASSRNEFSAVTCRSICSTLVRMCLKCWHIAPSSLKPGASLTAFTVCRASLQTFRNSGM